MRLSVYSLAALVVSLAACGGAPEAPKVPTESLDVGASKPAAPPAAKPITTDAPVTPSSQATEPKGPKAPTVDLPAVSGTGRVTIPAGKVVIVDFWATWCEPCKKSFPKLQDLYTKYKASGLEVIALSVDDENQGLAAFAKANGDVKFPLAWDKGHKLAEAFKVESMPSTYIIDKNGSIVHTHKGYHAGEDVEIEKELKALF